MAKRTFKINLIVLWIGCFITNLGNSMTMPFLPLFFRQLDPVNTKTLTLLSGIAFSITFLAKAIVSPFWGRLSDKKGRKLMCIRASGVMALTITTIGFAGSIWQVIVLRAIQGAFSGYINNATALLAGITSEDHRGHALGMLATGGVSGTLVGPLIGGVIAEFWGYRLSFYIIGFCMFAITILTLIFVKENFHANTSSKQLGILQTIKSIPHPKYILAIMITTMFIQVAVTTITPIISLIIGHMMTSSSGVSLMSGIVAAAPGIATLIVAERFGRLIDHVGPYKVLIFGLIFAMICFIPMGFARSVWLLAFLRFLVGISDAALLPSVQTAMAQVPKEIYGRVFSYSQSFEASGDIVGPMLGSFFANQFGYSSIFFAAAAVMLLNFVIVRANRRQA
ncbi:MFS transporter [Oenococcus kitaharae]|uniref:Multidrug resistance protein putative n=1 Tax=Oenococcus kitaharae DSM 17330 TaxID=1045004 RepID=G9WHB7_9LACO|nr:MFS transporter [Oenococcus kitaharae]EHN59762.1 multidrug resistance protein putative [Oenococcus kitaharae DSM 17330]OEY83586.1 multidrug transporter [Oenococcus kitaharae]OEY85384.1 multidrug transporter [Oenococcus kitaharae]OEY86237.1 multidrug transporter [Oenococcus kitaharae]